VGDISQGGSKWRLTAGLITAAALLLVALSLAPAARAVFPGDNGKIAFQSNRDGDWEIYVVNPDGSGETHLTDNSVSDYWPAWSPNGRKIAFNSDRDGNPEIYVMNEDGSGQTRITNNSAADSDPAWSPDGRVVFSSNRDGNFEIYVMNADGSGQTRITNTPLTSEHQPTWSPDGSLIAFIGSSGDPDLYVMSADGTATRLLLEAWSQGCDAAWYADPHWSPDSSQLAATYTAQFPIDDECSDYDFYTEFFSIAVDRSSSWQGYGYAYNPAWSPDGTLFAYIADGAASNIYGGELWTVDYPNLTTPTLLVDSSRYEDAPDWQPITPPGYARPRGGSPVNVRLVPAFRTCTNANATHGAPLNVSSCSPPTEESSYVTTGHGDAGRMAGLVTFKVVGESPINPSNGDQADVQLTASITDVRNPDLSDYTGELRISPVLRITDRQSGGAYSPPIHPATAMDTPFGFTLTCSTTTETNIGSTCSATTTADAVMPGLVREGKRSVWGLGQVQVFDGGADGDADTTDDNSLFLTQGLFAP
jgi:Tol biopolymer transport system component